jgi:hypothetical protein
MAPVVAFAIGAVIAALLLWAVFGDDAVSMYEDDEEARRP